MVVIPWDAVDLSSATEEMLHRHPSVGLGLGVVAGERLAFFHGHGVADIATATPISEDTVFRIASITKTFTAIAVMQLCEEGLVELDSPANDHLRAYALVPSRAGMGPVTVRHLLTHTAGLGELADPSGVFSPDFGESVPADEPLPSLAELYGGALVVHAEPGSRFVYQNHGPSTLGQLIADVSGEPLARYLREHVFRPLGMTSTELVRCGNITSRLATGYEIRAGGVEAVADREEVTAGAASVYSTPRDMARYLAALLGGGSNEHGSVLRAETLARMFEPHYRPDPRLSGMGLGFFRADLAGYLVVRHQGTLPGFHSEIAVVPDAGVAAMAFTNGARQPDFWLPVEAASLLRTLLGLPADAVRRDVAHRPEIWADLCGRYRLDARLTDVRLRGMLGAGAEVVVRDGRPTLRFLTPVPDLYRGFPLYPDDEHDPYVFRLDLSGSGLGTMRVAFAQDATGTTTRLHLEVMPLVLEKRPAVTTPRRAAVAALAGAGVVGAAATARRRRR
jgi:CubicO group peptidase (beta-lactamase class C family)